MIEFYLPINIYYCQIHVYIGSNFKKAEKKYNLDLSGHWMARCFCRESELDIPCVLVFKKNKISPAYVMHECIHAALFILNTKGIKIDTDNDEPLTYLSMWLFESIYQEIFEPYKIKKHDR